MKARHLRTLISICGAVNPKTGRSTISQETIGKTSSLSRKFVGPVVRDLEAWNLVKIHRRPRKDCGVFRTDQYEILYLPPDAGGTSAGCTDDVPAGGNTTVSPPEGSDSDLLDSDLNKIPEKDQSLGAIAADELPQSSGARQVSRRPMVPQYGQDQDWEIEVRNRAYDALQKDLSKRLSVEQAGDLLSSCGASQIERAVSLEQRTKGAGFNYLLKVWKNSR